jgi:hypothetical protein
MIEPLHPHYTTRLFAAITIFKSIIAIYLSDLSVVVLAIATLDLDSAYVQLVFIADFLVDLIP